MAANNQIVKKSIQIDAGDTLRTVKSLKQEISDLRDELLNLEQGTEEYDEVQKQLHDDVEDLNEVMGAHKDKAEALEGSYNALQAELKELKKAWKETNDEAERDVLGQKINDLNNQLKEMDASIGDFHRNVGNYESAWNGLTSVMENGEKVTDDLEKGIKAFGTALGMSDKQVNALSKSLKAMKDGFKIAKDIAKAREETGKLATEEAKATVQGTALAASQKATGAAAKTMAAGEVAAAGATKGLSIAMQGLKAALISTGIGALIVLLGSLTGALEKAFNKARQARAEKFWADTNQRIDETLNKLEKSAELMDEQEHQTELESRKAEARKKNEREILEYQVKSYEALEKWAKERAESFEELVNINQEAMEKLKESDPAFKMFEERRDRAKADLDEFNSRVQRYGKTIQNLKDDIEVYDVAAEYAKTHTENTVNELRKWADLVKDPKFRAAWKGLFEMDFTGASPIETLKAQMAAATALVKQFKGDISEVERLFTELISDAEAEWQSLVDKEKEIFDERLTPAQRLENEKAEWVAKAEKWGMETVNIVKYYDQKIQDELDKAEEERQAKREAELAEIEKQTQEQLQMMEDALSTQEKLDELFNQRGMNYGNYWFETGDTVQADIEKDMEDLQRLYDAQMQYLNGLLESADLTEEAYAGVESRILSLQVTFNNQMNELKKEADYQGKNFTLLSKKGVANITLLEDAFAGFSDLAQQLGGENSEAFKGFATAQALISAFLAANRVLAEEPGGIVVKGIAAAAALATGIANVMAIWGVNSDGSNASSSMNASMSQPAVPVIGNAQPINYVSNVSNAAEEDELNKYNIVVKVSDIEEGLEGQRVRVENSSF